MSDGQTRRRVLQLAGAALGALAGCSSISSRVGGPSSAPAEDARTTTSTPSTTARTTTTSSTTPTSTAQPTTDAPQSTTAEATRANESAQSSDATTVVQRPGPALPSSLVPADPGRYQYAVVGSTDATATATVYGNWKCPYTRKFVVNQLPTVVERFVAPGALRLEFRAIAYRGGEAFLGPDAPRAARAGLAVWRADPGSYWSYFGTVFANQPAEHREWATTDRLLAFADAAGVDNLGRVERDVESGADADAVRATVQAARERGVHTVPRVVAGGEVTAPTVDFSATMAQLQGVTDA